MEATLASAASPASAEASISAKTTLRATCAAPRTLPPWPRRVAVNCVCWSSTVRNWSFCWSARAPVAATLATGSLVRRMLTLTFPVAPNRPSSILSDTATPDAETGVSSFRSAMLSGRARSGLSASWALPTAAVPSTVTRATTSTSVRFKARSLPELCLRRAPRTCRPESSARDHPRVGPKTEEALPGAGAGPAGAPAGRAAGGPAPGGAEAQRRATSTRKSPRPRGWRRASPPVSRLRTRSLSIGSPSRARASSSARCAASSVPQAPALQEGCLGQHFHRRPLLLRHRRQRPEVDIDGDVGASGLRGVGRAPGGARGRCAGSPPPAARPGRARCRRSRRPPRPRRRGAAASPAATPRRRAGPRRSRPPAPARRAAPPRPPPRDGPGPPASARPSAPAPTSRSAHPPPRRTARATGRLSASSLATTTPRIGPGMAPGCPATTASGTYRRRDSRAAGDTSSAQARTPTREGVEQRAQQRPGAGPGVHHGDGVGAEALGFGLHETGQGGPEEGAHFGAGEEVPFPSRAQRARRRSSPRRGRRGRPP